jgi:cell division protein ZipA
MDAATLRLVLVVIGAVCLIALYLWEKQRAENAAEARRRRTPARARKQEPNLGRLGGHADTHAASSVTADGADDVAHPAGAGREAVLEHAAAVDETTAGGATPAGEELLIQLYITSAGSAFKGEEILGAAERCKLRPGDMDIFHRTRGDTPHGEPLFSMANLVKPGIFPFDDMTDFTSPGLAVFAQFRGEPSDLMVFDEMLDAARVMAELLGGDIRGPQREPLRDADAKELRSQVRALLHGSTEAADTP